MQDYYLAVDIGASSGRHIVFWMEDGRIFSEEIYRFENGMKKEDGKLLWDTERLFTEIKNGMKACRKKNRIPVSMAIDTWAVDYVLLDEEAKVLGDTFGYRDHRTDDMPAEVEKRISEASLYERTGIQKQTFNTIYQLTADRVLRPEVLKKAHTFLMLPDYFAYLLTGNLTSEYTNATSTQLIDPKTKQWDAALMELLGIPREIFLPLNHPGYRIGTLQRSVEEEVGFSCDVIACATHDTASAVMALPTDRDDALYISSGTWSLMGVELSEALSDENSRAGNFTNEGGYDYRFRYLKNIMGLWMIQSVRHEDHDEKTFAELAALAEEHDSFPSIVDANDPRFLSPEQMTEEIRTACRDSGQQVPKSLGELSACVYKSLAVCYGKALKEIERNTGKKYSALHIIGGGCQNEYLNRLTAKETNLPVYAGPAEATAIGNALSQLIRAGELQDLKEARLAVRRSFDIKTFLPEER